MRNRYLVFVLLTILVVGAGEVFAQMGTGRVSGTVKDTEGNPIEGAKIVAEMTSGDFELEATSDEKGRWAILGFRKGSYQFTVSAYRHVPQQFTTQVSGLGKNPAVNVTLGPFEPTRASDQSQEDGISAGPHRARNLGERRRPMDFVEDQQRMRLGASPPRS